MSWALCIFSLPANPPTRHKTNSPFFPSFTLFNHEALRFDHSFILFGGYVNA